MIMIIMIVIAIIEAILLQPSAMLDGHWRNPGADEMMLIKGPKVKSIDIDNT